MQVSRCVWILNCGNQPSGKQTKTGMKTRHSWIEIVSVSIAIACGFALLIALGVAAVAAAEPGPVQGAGSAGQPASAQTYEGVITDAHCGAKHLASISKNAADCARSCVHAGSQ